MRTVNHPVNAISQSWMVSSQIIKIFFSLFFRWVVSQKSLPFFLYLLFENANSSDSARMFMQGIDEHYECVSFGQINSTDLLSFRLIVRL